MGTGLVLEDLGLHGECQRDGSIRRSVGDQGADEPLQLRAEPAAGKRRSMPLLRHEFEPPERADPARSRLLPRAWLTKP